MTHAIHFFCPGKPSSVVVQRYRRALAPLGQYQIIWHTPAGTSSVFTALAAAWRISGRCLPQLLNQHPVAASGAATSVTLVAFSAGYGAVRQLLVDERDRQGIDAVVLLDAIHAGLDAEGRANDAQLKGFVAYAQRAKTATDALFWLGHTDVPTYGYASTTQTTAELLRLVGGEGGQFRVHSYDLFPPFKAKSEHAAALTKWGPNYLGEALVPHLSALALKRQSHLPWRDPSLTIGQRAVKWSLAQQALGGIETAGHNAGPIIASYHRGAKRRDANGIERSVGLRSGNWCVSGLAYGERRCLLENEQPVMPWRVSGMELQRDAAEQRLWRSAELVRTGVWRPEVGDVAIFVRPPHADPRREWRRHVGRVSIAPDTQGNYQTIDANHGDGWGTAQRNLSDRALLGFIAYPRQQPEALSQQVWSHIVRVSDDVLHGRYGLDYALAGLLPQDLVA